MKKLTLFVLLSFSHCKEAVDLTKATHEQKAFYTIGQIYAERIKYFNISEDEFKFINQGIHDQLFASKSDADFIVSRGDVQKLVMERTVGYAAKEKTKGSDYSKKFLKEEGGRITDSGLAYKILEPGDASRATLNDEVVVQYQGNFVDGKVFDATPPNEKATLPLGSVLPGWQEAVRLIGKGGKIQFVVPSDLGYGDSGSPPKIPGGATLVFELTLFDIVKH